MGNLDDDDDDDDVGDDDDDDHNDDVKRVLKGECSSPQTVPLTFREFWADEKPVCCSKRMGNLDHDDDDDDDDDDDHNDDVKRVLKGECSSPQTVPLTFREFWADEKPVCCSKRMGNLDDDDDDDDDDHHHHNDDVKRFLKGECLSPQTVPLTFRESCAHEKPVYCSKHIGNFVASKLDLDDDVKRVLKGECSSSQTDPLTFRESCVDEKPVYCSKHMGNFVASMLDDDDDDVKGVLKGECSSHQTPFLTFVCEICEVEKPEIESFRISSCHHSCCYECCNRYLEKYVASKLHDNVVAISCPLFWCKGKLEPQRCVSFLPKQVLDRWSDALCEAVILESVKLKDDDDVKRVLKGECSSPQTAPSTSFFCEICADEKPKTEIFRISGCDHSYCSECVKKYVASKLQDSVVTINCPVSGCKGKLEPEHCISILPKQVFDRWGDALCEGLISATEKFYCPFKDCSALLVDDKKGNNHEDIAESECPHCNRLFCAQCKVPWHSGICCGRFKNLNKDERSREDIMFLNLAKNQKWRRCPMCNIVVEKIDGCLYMTCRCGNNFCYGCGLPNVDHFLHVCAHKQQNLN